MNNDKQGLIAALEETAALLELQGENAFHSRAYEQGARTLETLAGEPSDWLEQGLLNHTPGIGKSLAEKVEEWVKTGRISRLEELRRAVPPGLLEMLTIPGLGPKKIKAVHEGLGISNLAQLEAAAQSGALATLTGFGAKTAAKILAGIQQRRQYAARHTIDEADRAAAVVLGHLMPLKDAGQIDRIELAGSLRRARETIKDLDFLVTSRAPQSVMQAFLATPGIESVVARGETKSSILLRGGIPVDLRVVEPSQFPAALNYFTGSKEHNTALRGRAKRLGLKLNEYGLFPEGEATAPLPAKEEADIYRHLGLAYIEPELRENMGEIEAAEKSELPRLIAMDDLQGVLHCHTLYSDGILSVRELAEACRDAGYHYVCICDHSQSAFYASGLKRDDLLRQWDEIDRVNEQLKGFHIFKGIESDILADGALDYPAAILERFDLVVASIHSRMSMDREAMTERVCRALENPATTILGHPTGRLLLKREPFAIDMERVFEVATRHGVVMEINTHPRRLDLDWRILRQAKAAGCRFAINPDAHSPEDLTYIRYGVGIARKGWLEKQDVINTMPAKAFQTWLKKRKTSS